MSTDRPSAVSSRVDAGQGSRAGFTMVEVIIALIVLAVGVLGLAGTTAYIVRQVTLADVVTQRAVALQTVIESVQAMPFDSVSAGSDSIGSFAVSWWPVDESTSSRLVTVITVGPGVRSSSSSSAPFLGPGVADTFVIRKIAP